MMERILVTKSENLLQFKDCFQNSSLCLDVKNLNKFLSNKEMFEFVERRNEIEEKNNLIQITTFIIPIINNKYTLFFKSKKGRNKIIGGHINEDDFETDSSVHEAVRNCCVRELLEEVEFLQPNQIIGFKNVGMIFSGFSNSTPPHSNHLGSIYLVYLNLDLNFLTNEEVLSKHKLILHNLEDKDCLSKNINCKDEVWLDTALTNDELLNCLSLENKKNLIGLELTFDDLYGYVQLLDYMGSDEDVVLAAKASYGVTSVSEEDIVRLLDYLMRHRHTSPFEMCELKFRIRVPMDCWRQFVRHRTASINERSTRYTKALLKTYKRGKNWNLQHQINKQSSSDEKLSEELAIKIADSEEQIHRLCLEEYKKKLAFGVSKEQARKDLPLCTYTEAIWKMDLHNLLHFLDLRLRKEAQYEIRRYASLIKEFVKKLYPITYSCFEEHVLEGVRLSKTELEILKRFLDVKKLKESEEVNKLKKTKKLEFFNKLKI